MRTLVLAALVSALGAVAPLSAQIGVCPPLQYAAINYVDPVNGVDAFGGGALTAPFKTLNYALSTTAGQVAGLGEGLVLAMPGVYSTATNGEILPVQMYDHVHLSGIGAKECVLRGGGQWTQLPGNFSFLPTVPNPPGSTPGSHPPNGFEIGFWFGFNANDEGDPESSVENFTIQGCMVQAYVRGEAEVTGRISNCLFDLRDMPDEGLIGPDFGVLIVNAVLTGPMGPEYFDMKFKVFNNTFIQATHLGDGSNQAAVPQNVAICDTNDPNPGGFVEDPTPYLFGISKPHIQNNIIRDLPGMKRTAMLGIDRMDTTVSVGTVLGNTNAFDRTEALHVDLTGTYASRMLGPVPQPKVDTGVIDPAFVGELVGRLNATMGLPFTAIRDFRLVPDSPMSERGSSPRYAAGSCNGLFQAGNNTLYTDHPLGSWLHGSFDYDGEGHGNLRTVAIRLAAAETDIGFDEIDNLIVAGSYANESKSHNFPWDVSIGFGSQDRWYIAPTAVGLPPVSISAFASSVGYPPVPGPAYPVYPGLGPLLPPFVPAPGMAPSYLWLTGAISFLGSAPLTLTTVTDILNPLVTHSFLSFVFPWLDVGPQVFLNEQAWYVDGAGNPILTFPLDRLSNSQSEHF